jgi:hypothetical protein
MKAHLEDAKKIDKVREFQSYILNNWDCIIDWRECVDNPPEDAREAWEQWNPINARLVTG